MLPGPSPPQAHLSTLPFLNQPSEAFAHSLLVKKDQHPFFIGTLFQPERSAFQGVVHPLIKAFLQAAEAVSPTPIPHIADKYEPSRQQFPPR